jgi:hypothetical protein
LKDEEAIDWCKRISKLSLDKEEQVQGGSWRLTKEEGIVCYGKNKEKEKENEVGERLLILVCGRCSWKGYEKMKHEMELCVTRNRSKASGLLV